MITQLKGDPPTLFKGAEGVEFRPKRFVNRTLSLDDVKYVKSSYLGYPIHLYSSSIN
jgi:hypothetical protein